MDMYVFIEEPNVRYGLTEFEFFNGWGLNYNALIKYLRNLFQISKLNVKIYIPLYPNGANKNKSNFLKLLEEFNFEVYTKKMRPIHSSKTGNLIGHKCNFDVEITSDIHDLMEISDKKSFITIISGDIDFLYLIKKINSRGFSSVLVSFEKTTSFELKNTPNDYISFEHILKNNILNNVFFDNTIKKTRPVDERFAKLAKLK